MRGAVLGLLSAEGEKLEGVNRAIRNNFDANALAEQIKESLLGASGGAGLKKKNTKNGVGERSPGLTRSVST